jgi:hypothetical protein
MIALPFRNSAIGRGRAIKSVWMSDVIVGGDATTDFVGDS